MTPTINTVHAHGDHDHSDQIEEKIIHLLGIYPKISPSMMQSGIGSSLPANMWKPVLRNLIDRKVVNEDYIVAPTPTGRQQSYTVLSLVANISVGA